MAPIIINFTFSLSLISQFYTILPYEANTALELLHPHDFLQFDLYPNLYFGIKSVLILLILPVLNFIIVPSFPKLTIRARIGIGLLLYLIGDLAVVLIHSVPLATNGLASTVSDDQLWCLLIPMVFFALAESLSFVSGLF